MKCYLLTWDRLKTDNSERRDQITALLNTIPDVVNWRAVNGAILFVTEHEHSPEVVQEKIHARFHPNFGFLITPINITEIRGYSDQKTWDFIKNPRMS